MKMNLTSHKNEKKEDGQSEMVDEADREVDM